MRSSSISSSGGVPTSPIRSSAITSPGGGRHPPVSSSGRLPPPPPLPLQQPSASSTAGTGTSLSMTAPLLPGGGATTSMTIEEMRAWHERALQQAEAKETELRLVLASRYRELVGSSDQVIKMKERAQELHALVHALPTFLSKLSSTEEATVVNQEEEAKLEAVDKAAAQDRAVAEVRRKLSTLVRAVNRALDADDVFAATQRLQELLSLMDAAAPTDRAYPLVHQLAKNNSKAVGAFSELPLTPLLSMQIRMTFLQVQTLPRKMVRMAAQSLRQAASYGGSDDDDDTAAATFGAQRSASALSCLHLLTPEKKTTHQLLETYYEAKAELLVSLLNQLATKDDEGNQHPHKTDHQQDPGAKVAEEILSKIVLILQYDVILHPYQIFCLGKFPTSSDRAVTCDAIVETLPLSAERDTAAVQARCSKFLAAHIPLLRTKVKSVLMTIAGTTASALGQIRQSLYDKTDGQECLQRLNDSARGTCTWDQAVQAMVNVHTVAASSSDATTTVAPEGSSSSTLSRKQFSLWSSLFSNTFSSLVHSILTTSFLSVHTRVVSTLQASLTNAPPLAVLLPHEAHGNTVQIATELDQALLQVSDDAHELLVHAEERVESERRLRQSLYVQTCEIMGRLVCELRRMTFRPADDVSDATKELIIGRLCYLLKFRLTSLSTLLDPKSSPAAMHGTSGMISHVDLQSAFDLADDNEDGLITFEEALQAVESAFSGTQFNGAAMLRETLLILTADKKDSSDRDDIPMNLTLSELTLLTARGLRHEESGANSALGAVQKSLDDIVDACFEKWATSELSTCVDTFGSTLRDFLHVASTSSLAEWQRLHVSTDGTSMTPPTQTSAGAIPATVSPFVVGYFLDVSSLLDRTTCPSDSLAPVPSVEYAASLGVDESVIPTLMDTIRSTLLRQSAVLSASTLDTALSSAGASLNQSCAPALLQLSLDVSFVKYCYFERTALESSTSAGAAASITTAKQSIDSVVSTTDALVGQHCDRTSVRTLSQHVPEKQRYIFEVCDLLLSSLFRTDSSPQVSTVSDVDIVGSAAAQLIQPPLVSSRRFVLLPVQAERSLSELQRGKYRKAKERESRPEEQSTGMMSTGLGFFSGILKKK